MSLENKNVYCQNTEVLKNPITAFREFMFFAQSDAIWRSFVVNEGSGKYEDFVFFGEFRNLSDETLEIIYAELKRCTDPSFYNKIEGDDKKNFFLAACDRLLTEVTTALKERKIVPPIYDDYDEPRKR